MDTRQQKQQARAYVKERMDRMNAKERETESRTLCKRILENLPADTKTVCAYYPMPSEVNILALLEELLKKGITVSLPRTEGRAFNFRSVTSLAGLPPGPFRIPEPRMEDPLTEIASVDLVLMPGVGFDRAGNRLGRGNGGYDQWLQKLRAANPEARCWGICFDDQVINAVPVEPHDEKIDALVTPRGLTVF